jgi:hypothetical protein
MMYIQDMEFEFHIWCKEETRESAVAIIIIKPMSKYSALTIYFGIGRTTADKIIGSVGLCLVYSG